MSKVNQFCVAFATAQLNTEETKKDGNLIARTVVDEKMDRNNKMHSNGWNAKYLGVQYSEHQSGGGATMNEHLHSGLKTRRGSEMSPIFNLGWWSSFNE